MYKVATLDKIHTHCLEGFKNYTKHYFISNYAHTCVIQNCYIATNIKITKHESMQSTHCTVMVLTAYQPGPTQIDN